MLLFRVASAAAAPSSSTTTIPHLPVRYEPLISLEHVNINAGGTWTEQLSRFWFSVMGGADDPRGAVVCSQVQAAGGPMQGLHWANFGLQQFHLPVGEPEDSVQVLRHMLACSISHFALSSSSRLPPQVHTPHATPRHVRRSCEARWGWRTPLRSWQRCSGGWRTPALRTRLAPTAALLGHSLLTSASVPRGWTLMIADVEATLLQGKPLNESPNMHGKIPF